MLVLMTGSIRPGGGGVSHFGLALQEYTHFTSPIRRYADVVVHRQLLQAIKAADHDKAAEAVPAADDSLGPQPLMSHAELSDAADVMNERHRASKRAQKECSDLYLLLLLHRYAGAAKQGVQTCAISASWQSGSSAVLAAVCAVLLPARCNMPPGMCLLKSCIC